MWLCTYLFFCKPFVFCVSEFFYLYVCVVFEAPGTWWAASGDGKANGEGERVGESGMGDGDGVRANGDKGIWPTDFLRFGEWGVFVLTCNLYLRPCRDEGLADGDVVPLAPGEQGTESAGLKLKLKLLLVIIFYTFLYYLRLSTPMWYIN